MRVLLYFLCFLNSCCNFFHCLSIPGVNVDKNTLTSLGIKTLDWQESENSNAPPIQVHHNYSKVSHQIGQANNINNPQLHNDLQEQLTLKPTNYDQQQTIEDFAQKNENQLEQKVTLTDQYETYFKTDQENNNNNQPNREKLRQLDSIVKAESKFQEQDLNFYNRIQNERQPKKFFQVNEPINIHGFKFPPSPEDFLPNNKQSYTECPKQATGQFVYSYSCNQFLNCWKGRGFVTNCSPGTLFNPVTLECDYASKVKCVMTPIQPSNVTDQAVDIKCPPNFFGAIPHHSDCSKYVSCINGVANLRECRSGTLFSLKINGCDSPQYAECAGWSSNFGKFNASVVSRDQISITTPNYTSVKKKNTRLPMERNVNVTSGNQIKNNNSFLNGPSQLPQPALHHTQNTQDNSNIQGQEALNYNRFQGHTESYHSIEVQTEYSIRINQKVGCPPGGSGLFPHPDDCSKFLNCASGQTFIQECGPGTVFNPAIKVCDYPYNVECNINHENHGENVIDIRMPPGSVNSGISPNVLSHKVNKIEQNAGQNYNSVNCPSGVSGLYPHPYICSKFLNCDNGRTFIQDCGPGTVFNPITKVCDFPYNVDCNTHHENHGENVIDIRMPPGSVNSNVSPNVLSHKVNKIDQNSGQNYNSANCPFGVSGLYPHPYICSKFLNCDNGQTFILDCGPGTVFNPTRKICDFPYNVDCESTNEETVIDVKIPIPSESHSHNKTVTIDEDTFNKLVEQVYGKRATTIPPLFNIKPDIIHQNNVETDQVLDNQIDDEVSSEILTYAPLPSTDINADYDFGNGGLELDVDSSNHGNNFPAVKPTPKYNNCDMLNFYCSINECIPQSMVCDGNEDCLNAGDELNCERFTNKYVLFQNAILAVREKEKFLNISVAYCAKTCLESKGFRCKSFSYRKDDGACFLSDLNVGNSGALITSHPYDYYELKSASVNCTTLHKCPNQKCIEVKQICDGINDCVDRSDEKGCSAESFGYAIRLAGTNKKHEGRIEVKAFGKWGYICDDRFGLRNADVVCREVGFGLGSLEVKSNSYYAKDLNETDVFYLMDDVTCLGNESSVRDCDFNGWGVSNCESQEVVGIICKTPQETCPVDNWKCDTVQECIPLAFVCDGVFDCTDQSDEGTQHCDAPTELRLVNGNSKLEGRVEIRYHGIWGTICDDDFNDDAAKVVCKSLGFFGNGIAKKEGAFGPGSGPIWLDQVFCQGNETSLGECIHWNWGEHNCEHAEDVGVVCSTSQVSLEYNPNSNNKIIEKHQNIDISSERPFSGRCGYRKDDLFIEDDVHFRVIKGSVARKGDYPWQASLRIKNKSKPTHWCGAIVISNKFVLTAAHCLIGFAKGAYFVTAGDYNTDEIEGTEQEAYIEEFYIHEKFRNGQKMNNDIALIKLKGEGLVFTKDIQPICLPEADKPYESGINCTISGFGSIQSGVSGYSHDLRAGWIKIQPIEVCQMPHVYGSAITEGMICAGSLDEGVDACDGDSGGPLACLNNGLFTLYGITSWGQHCGHANKPGVYVKVSHYRNWIDDTIRKHS